MGEYIHGVFPTRSEAQQKIAELDQSVYYLAHNEYGRPEHTARKVRNKDEYYVHVRKYFYGASQ